MSNEKILLAFNLIEAELDDAVKISCLITMLTQIHKYLLIVQEMSYIV